MHGVLPPRFKYTLMVLCNYNSDEGAGKNQWVCLAAYGLDNRSSIPGRVRKFFFSPPLPNRFLDPPSLLSSEYRELFLLG